MRLLIVAAQPALRVGLRALLEEEGLEVFGSSPTLFGLDELLEEVDVLVLAGEMAVDDVARVLPVERPVGLVLLGDGELAEEIGALPLRGLALLPLDVPPALLAAACHAVAAALVVLPHPEGVHRLGLRSRPTPLIEPLTEREQEVLDLLGEGQSNRAIATRLQISEHTVKFHVSSLLGKLGASSRTEAVTLGARHGLILL